MVSHVPVPLLTEESVVALPVIGPSAEVRDAMARLCATPAPEALPVAVD
jgi:hypothetical protein